MNKTVITVFCILGFTTLACFYIWSSNNRFYVSSSEKGMCYEVDRRTGDSWLLVGEVKTSQIDPSKEALFARTHEEKLPNEDVVKVTGNAGFYSGTFSGKIYNGSNWKISRIIFTVTATHKKNGLSSLFSSSDWKRDISSNVSIDPLKTTTFSETITGDDYTTCARVKNLGVTFHGRLDQAA